MVAMIATLTAVLFGAIPLVLGVGIGVLAMRGVLAALEVAVSRTLASKSANVTVEAAPAQAPAVVLPFSRERRERTTGDLRQAA